MKTHINYIIIILISFGFTSCEDVVDIDLSNADPRLVIEASIDWEKGTAGNEQTIKLSTSTPYFDTTTNSSVIGALVKITNDIDTTEFVFLDQNDGTYITTSFVPVINQAYTLEVIYNNEIYIAKETMMSVSEITEVTQSVEGGFDDELIEVTIFFDDPADEENYYMVRFFEQGDLFPTLEDISDEFVNGNLIDTFFEKEDDDDNDEFEPGDVVDIDLHGVSEQYHNYIRLLIEQYDSGGDPFSTIPAALRGNCTNATMPDNYAFGYFRLTEVDRITYTIQ